MKKIQVLFVFLVFATRVFSQVKLCSWNLQNFGKSKSDSVILFIAENLKDFDLVAIVEVVAGNGGAQAVARLDDALDRTGSSWDYCISDPTSGTTTVERYAFLWKKDKLKKKGDAWLEKKYQQEIEREPYFATFSSEEKEFTVGAFHARPKEKQPETEIKFFKLFPGEYPEKTLLFCGDFNCPQSHTVFTPLKEMDFKPALNGQKTSLKMECNTGGCLASEYDNVFYNSTRMTPMRSGVVHFYKNFNTLKKARRISDHIPVYFEFFLN